MVIPDVLILLRTSRDYFKHSKIASNFKLQMSRDCLRRPMIALDVSELFWTPRDCYRHPKIASDIPKFFLSGPETVSEITFDVS